MRFGVHLRELSRLPVSLAVSALLAALAAVWSVASISVLPPKLKPRSMEMATAFTQVVVDTPNSTVLDLRQPTDEILPLTNRALLIGTLMTSMPVRAHVAERAGVAPERLQVVAPRTPEHPRPRAERGAKNGAGDLLKSTDQYRLDVQANPTVPFLDIYAQAPTEKAAQRLANAAVGGLRAYVRELAASEKAPRAAQVTLRQLGRARGDVINPGVQLQAAGIVFSLVFAFSCAATLLIGRVRRGWVLAAVPRA